MKAQMNSKEKSVNHSEADEREGLLVEYKTLRDEILNAKGRRLQTVSLTVGAFGVILSIIAGAVFGTNMPTSEMQLTVAVGGGIALCGIVIPSLIMTISLQQTIQRIGDYIRVFIEPRVPGLNWENRWRTHKVQSHLPRGLRGIGGIYYFLSLLPLLLPTYMLAQNVQHWPLVLALIPFTCWSLYLSYDMHAAVSKGWKWQWESFAKETPPKKNAG